MSNVVIDKDELMLLINKCEAIKEKKFALECLDKDPDKFIRILFRVMDNLCEGLKTKEDMLQDALRECTRLRSKCDDLSKDISDIYNKVSDAVSNRW